MTRFARLVLARPLVSLLVFLGIIALASVWGLQAFGSLQSSGYSDPGSESAQVARSLEDTFGNDPVDLVVIADFPQSVDADASETSASDIASRIANIDGVREVTSYYSLGRPDTLKSTDDTACYIFIRYDEAVSGAQQTSLIEDTMGASAGDVALHYTGIRAMANALNLGISMTLGSRNPSPSR